MLVAIKDKEHRICRSPQSGRLDVEYVNGRFTSAQAFDDSNPEILIRQEADCHARFRPICRRAVSRRANSSGFD
jgi:hypothetical protein